MKERVLYKSLVTGVIVLFIGVGIQPAIAVDISKSSSNNEDDCELCPTISKLMDVENEEEYEKISVEKNRFVELNYFLKLNILKQSPKDICTELFIELIRELAINWILILLPFTIILSLIIPSLNDLFKERYDITDEIFFTAVRLDCDWAVPFKTILGEDKKI
ncbi:MAG: hypothetical protein AYK22_09090 [Thermoplasmatales archaeon SG8-52-3]|nr:MAG: hypothetical protein AYK22_09090 [Thermoplasmatales archaeon SG8-52-3]